jgi:hypothetical protein
MQFYVLWEIISNFTPFIYGASLCALSKKDGGIRPIAIGSTFRRLASKLGCYYLSGEISNYLKPKQLGFGTRSGCEAAVHSVRSYLTNYSAEVFLKIDVKNAFIFCLSIHPTIERLSSHFNVWYLDDGALGGSAETVLKDLETII